jgi:hypothetical protein
MHETFSESSPLNQSFQQPRNRECLTRDGLFLIVHNMADECCVSPLILRGDLISHILYECILAFRVDTEAIQASKNWSRNQQEGFQFWHLPGSYQMHRA